MLEGGCYCGKVRYAIEGEPVYVAICNCTDCRKHSGAPMVCWSAFRQEQVTITGEAATFASSEHARRQFCAACGTGFAYTNEVVLPGLIDLQTGTLDDPEALPPMIQVQTADRLSWMNGIGELPGFERYPSGGPEPTP